MVVCVTQMCVSMPVRMTDRGFESAVRREVTCGTSIENAVLSISVTGVGWLEKRVETSETVSPSRAAFWVVTTIGMLRMDAVKISEREK